MDIKIEQDDRDGYYYVKQRHGKIWKMKSRHMTFEQAIMSLVTEHESKVTALLRRVARYMCGGHYEPRNDDEAKLSKEIFDMIGIS